MNKIMKFSPSLVSLLEDLLTALVSNVSEQSSAETKRKMFPEFQRQLDEANYQLSAPAVRVRKKVLCILVLLRMPTRKTVTFSVNFDSCEFTQENNKYS